MPGRVVAVTFAKMLVLLAAKDALNKQKVDGRVRGVAPPPGPLPPSPASPLGSLPPLVQVDDRVSVALTDERDAARASRDAMQVRVGPPGWTLVPFYTGTSTRLARRGAVPA